jgi:hypothetical protein
MIMNQTNAWKLMGKAKFTSQKGVCASDLSQASQHTHGGSRTVSIFIPDVGTPLAVTEGAQVHGLCDWLRLRFRVDVLKDIEVTHKEGVLGFWGNWGLKWLFDLKWQHQLYNLPMGQGDLKQRFFWTMIILKLAVWVLVYLMTNNSLLKGRNFTARWHATEHIDN